MGDKKHDRITIRVEDRLYQLAVELQRLHRARDLSEYLRGLLIRDAASEGRSIDGLYLPGWINNPELRALQGRGEEQGHAALEASVHRSRKSKQQRGSSA